jgi:hypothetical protein
MQVLLAQRLEHPAYSDAPTPRHVMVVDGVQPLRVAGLGGAYQRFAVHGGHHRSDDAPRG